ncbi:hypothetical protein [Rummeliibacillus stabekisii]|uniref:Protein kinase domain-containing protein n=1 Tax=Rummeliibacillus stabekisii TaxID=241244 RepID=A0A143HEB6_9BACL|nr:hypothetical protein [Rummeliibacillus stabekisii]AMW99779.1 hypothetical protein ATY39_10210 [Rummeliibacillus stabekisii]
MIDYKNIDFTIYQVGGSCCDKYIYESDKQMYIKEIKKEISGVDNGFKKLFYEIEHMKKNNEIYEKLYPKIYHINDDKDKYSVAMEYCFDGITLADLLRNNIIEQDYTNNSIKYVLDTLFDTVYQDNSKSPNKNYIIDNYTGRIKNRLNSLKDIGIVKVYGFSNKLYKMMELGFVLNDEFYPPIFDYINFIEKDNSLLNKLQILNTTDSHHDLIPGNILVKIDENYKSRITDFKLIDPRGVGETGSDNRHYTYDIGKLLLGADTLDIFRIFNGKCADKLYQYECVENNRMVDEYKLEFDINSPIVKKYDNTTEFIWEYLMSHPRLNEYDILRFLFSQACMYHPDVPCRIIDEKDEEIAICMYLRGSMMLRKFMDYVYGSDPFKERFII